MCALLPKSQSSISWWSVSAREIAGGAAGAMAGTATRAVELGIRGVYGYVGEASGNDNKYRPSNAR